MFHLHPTLAADTFLLDSWEACEVRVMNNTVLPWLILIPREPGLKELQDLTPHGQSLVMAEITRASRLLSFVFQPDKINVAALGNVVSQLHIHVVARFHDDPLWPGTVWGQVSPSPYTDQGREDLVSGLRTALIAMDGVHK